MQRRRKLTYNADCRQYLGNSPPGSPALSSSPPCSPSSGTSSPVLMDSSSTPSTSTSYKHHHHHHRRLSGDAPLFTQKQVSNYLLLFPFQLLQLLLLLFLVLLFVYNLPTILTILAMTTTSTWYIISDKSHCPIIGKL